MYLLFQYFFCMAWAWHAIWSSLQWSLRGHDLVKAICYFFWLLAKVFNNHTQRTIPNKSRFIFKLSTISLSITIPAISFITHKNTDKTIFPLILKLNLTSSFFYKEVKIGFTECIYLIHDQLCYIFIKNNSLNHNK